MSVDLTLHRTIASSHLVPARFVQAFELLGKLAPTEGPKATMRGQELRAAIALPLDDAACLGFMLDFAGQGLRVRGTARGPSSAVLVWAFHALAHAMKCTLHDEEEGKDLTPAPEVHRAAALAYLEASEEAILTARRSREAPEGAAFLAWLAAEDQIALGEDDSADLAEALPMDDAPALYEMLLESDDVEDVFVSERELVTLLARFRARFKSFEP